MVLLLMPVITISPFAFLKVTIIEKACDKSKKYQTICG